jgi:hypothetical protein
MPAEVIPYQGRPETPRRLSKAAVLAFVLGFLSCPLLSALAFNLVFRFVFLAMYRVPGRSPAFAMFLAAARLVRWSLIGLPVASAAIAALGVYRTNRRRTEMRGRKLAVIGLAFSLTWCVLLAGAFAWAMLHD